MRFLLIQLTLWLPLASTVFAATPETRVRLQDTFPEALFKDVPKDVMEKFKAFLADPGHLSDQDEDDDGKVIFRSFKKEEDSGYVSLGFEATLDIPFVEAASVWFANSKSKRKFLDHCKDFVPLESTPLIKFDDKVFGFTKTTVFISEAIWPTWARVFYTDNVVVANGKGKDRWVGSINYSTRNPERLDPGFRKVDEISKTVTGELFFGASFMQEKGNKTWVNFAVYINPNGEGGRIPAIIVNQVSSSWPKKTKDQLVDLVTNHKDDFEVVDFFSGKYDPQDDILPMPKLTP